MAPKLTILIMTVSCAILIIFFVYFLCMLIFPNIYGHGLSNDQFKIIDDNDRSFTVEGKIYPSFIEDVTNNNLNPTMLVRTFDTLNNETVKNISYNVKVKMGKEVVLNHCFIPQDGIIYVEFIPDSSINPAKIYSKEDVEHDSCIQEIRKDNPVLIKSKIFSTGGLYHFSLDLNPTLRPDSENSNIEISQKKSVDLFITLGENQEFDLRNSSKKLHDVNFTHILIKSYYDRIYNLRYDEHNTTQKITFQMPFNWNQSYVNQVSLLHLELSIPKNSLFAKKNSYIGTLDGNILPPKSVSIDDYSSDIYRIIHMVINSDKLDQFVRQSSNFKNQIPFSDHAMFSLTPTEEPRFPMEIISKKNKYLFQISWNPEKIIFENKTTFIINVQDPKSGDLLRHTSFDFILQNNNIEVYREHITTDFGALTKDVIFPFSKNNQFSILLDQINGEDDGILFNLSVN